MTKVLVSIPDELIVELDALAGRSSRSAVIVGLIRRGMAKPIVTKIVAARAKTEAQPFKSRLKGVWKAP